MCMVWLYVFAGVVLFCAFCVYFHLWFKLSITVDIINLKASLCVTFFKLKTICIDAAIENGFIVIYNRKGIPVYLPIVQPKKDGGRKNLQAETNLYFPIMKKIRFKSLCMTTAIGAAGNAASTALALSVSRLAYDVVFSVMSHRNIKMKVCRELIPVYDRNCIKTEISSIFIISLANIIIYIATMLVKGIGNR